MGRDKARDGAAQGMILAAGSGTRLLPLTRERAKPMVRLDGRPVLEYTLAWLRYYGLKRLVINLHHHPESIEQYFGDGAAFGVELTYSLEQSILGTAGGVKRAISLLDDTFVVVYGDVLTDLNLPALLRFHRERSKGAPCMTLVLYTVDNPWECGVVALGRGNRVVGFVEKPPRAEACSNVANAGVMVAARSLMDHVPDDQPYDFGRDLLPDLLAQGVPVYGWQLPDDAYLLDMGTPSKYERAQLEWPTAAARSFLAERTSGGPTL